jgi:periplasmic protein CpxP/Spy
MRINLEMLREPLLAAVLLTGVAAVGLAPALAQTAAAPATSTTPIPAEHHRGAWSGPGLMPGQLADGRIAFLKAELKITPAQEAQWQKVAAAMRQNADALDQTIGKARDYRGKADAIERMEMREQLARVRADNAARLLAAFKPLYASLSPAQQQTANALLAMEHGWHSGWHHRA